MTVVYKSDLRHIDADCLLRATVESDSTSTKDNEDDVFIGALNVQDMATLQRNNAEFLAVIEHMEGNGNALPSVLACPRATSGPESALPMVLVKNLSGKIFQACLDDPTAGHLGNSRTLARIRQN